MVVTAQTYVHLLYATWRCRRVAGALALTVMIIITFILTHKNIHVKSNYLRMQTYVNWIIRPRVILSLTRENIILIITIIKTTDEFRNA